MFSWKPIYIELGQRLLAYRNKQGELLEWLRQMKAAGLPVVGLNDQKPEGASIPLAEIDPFTFFANFNRGIKDAHRIEILKVLKDKMQLAAQLPVDFNGVPLANLQKAWFFPSAFLRGPDDVPTLWDFAQDVASHESVELNEDLFARCLDVKQIAVPKLTMGMFWLRPDRYLALDQVNRTFLEEKHGFATKELKPKSLKAYLQVIDSVRTRVGTDFAKVSYDAYIHGTSVDVEVKELDRGFRGYL
jgi:5-methylcytosine-specific restriction protein B